MRLPLLDRSPKKKIRKFADYCFIHGPKWQRVTKWNAQGEGYVGRGVAYNRGVAYIVYGDAVVLHGFVLMCHLSGNAHRDSHFAGS